MRPSLWATAALLLAASECTEVLEIDIVHPRNATYIAAEVFPIAFRMQNFIWLSDADLDGLSIFWGIMPYGNDGHTPGGIHYDSGTIRAANDSSILVATTNVTEWIGRSQRNDRYMLQWSLSHDSCGKKRRLTRGNLMFDIATEQEAITYEPGELHMVMDVPACPEFAVAIEYGIDATESQCLFGKVVENTEGNPCLRELNRNVYSSILSHASSLAAPTSTTSATSTSSSAGVGPARTVQTALAAACLLGGLAL
ncbi:uncharacterized protein B0H64DRAFT_471050 [Chaetomium fimeti]|uniref:DUF7136 domain-containing protein n=1 Tax=Chaetomium fimeti TaxID=1854472 RepID=A0AAE0HQY4_9PEZI|nr:hypothetical protein B0H64DRAFT_471050 [Chaetomium fimeti]